MRRRAFLAVAAASFGGCSTDDTGGESTPTPTETPTPTPTSTSTPTPSPTPTPSSTPTPTPGAESFRPHVWAVALVSGWTEYGDVTENEIQSVEPDEDVIIGVRFSTICNDAREVRWRNTTTVRRSGDAVASKSDTTEQFRNDCGVDERAVRWEQAVELHYNNEVGAEWPVGTYVAHVRIDDYYSGSTTGGSALFEVVSP